MLAVWRFARVRPGLGLALPVRSPRRQLHGMHDWFEHNPFYVPGYAEEDIPYDLYAETRSAACVADRVYDGLVRACAHCNFCVVHVSLCASVTAESRSKALCASERYRMATCAPARGGEAYLPNKIL